MAHLADSPAKLETEVRESSSQSASLGYLSRQTTNLAAEIAAWLKAHPEIDVTRSDETLAPEDREKLQGTLAGLKETVEDIARSGPNNPFDLGRVEINVSAERAADAHRRHHRTERDTPAQLPDDPAGAQPRARRQSPTHRTAQ